MKCVKWTLLATMLTLMPACCLTAQDYEPADSASAFMTVGTRPGYGHLLPCHIAMPGAFPGSGLYDWDLHRGMNLQVETGVRVGWGRHNPWRGASFFTNLGGMYALPLSKDGRWTAAMGGYFSSFRFLGQRDNTFGLMGAMDYSINQRLSIFGFLAHDFGVVGASAMTRPPVPLLETPATTIGAGINCKLTEKTAFSVSLSFTRESHGQPEPWRPHTFYKE